MSLGLKGCGTKQDRNLSRHLMFTLHSFCSVLHILIILHLVSTSLFLSFSYCIYLFALEEALMPWHMCQAKEQLGNRHVYSLKHLSGSRSYLLLLNVFSLCLKGLLLSIWVNSKSSRSLRKQPSEWVHVADGGDLSRHD